MARLAELPELPAMERAMLEIDLRLAEVWDAIGGLETLNREQTAHALRCAYLAGARDAAPASVRTYLSLISTISTRAAAELRRSRQPKKKRR